jgi:sugar lactone lactonase YvrE
MIHRIDEQAFDHYLADWLDEEAGSRTPAYLDETLARLDGVSQRRARASLERWLPMSVITARPLGAPRSLASVGVAVALTLALIVGLVVAASQALRDARPDPERPGLILALEQDTSWDASTIPGLDEPIVGDIGPDGDLYVLNGGTNEVLVLGPNGSLVRRIGQGSGTTTFDVRAWPDDPYGFTSMGDVAVGPDGTVYVTDKVNDHIAFYRPDGSHGAFGSYGPDDGELLDPIGLAVAPDGRLHVYDSQRRDIQVFEPDGTWVDTVGQRVADDGATLSVGRLAIADDGSTVIADLGDDEVHAWDADGALRWHTPVSVPGDAEFAAPRDVDMDTAGNVFVTDRSVQLLAPDGTALSRWLPDVEPTEVGLGPMFVVAGPDGSVYLSMQLFDTIRRFRVVEQELVEDDPAITAAPSVLPSPNPGPTAAPSAAPVAVTTRAFDQFAVPFTLDLPATWHVEDQGLGIVSVGENQPEGGGAPIWILATIVENVFTDPCHPSTTAMDPPLGPGVDDLVEAMTHLVGFRAGPVTDVELDGHPGKVFDLENSLDPSRCEGDPWLPQMTYERVPGFIDQRGPGGEFHQKVYVLDVDGRRVLVESWSFGDTTRENVVEVDEVLRTIDFD